MDQRLQEEKDLVGMLFRNVGFCVVFYMERKEKVAVFAEKNILISDLPRPASL